jgi:chitodextrinase
MKQHRHATTFDARRVRAALLALVVSAAPGAPADAAGRSIQTFLVYYGGGPQLVAGDEQRLAGFDLIDIDRFRYNQIGANTWAAIKAHNPAVQIYLYEIGPETQNYMDSLPAVSLNGLGRYNVSRGHTMGALNGNNPGLYLLDGGNQRIYSVPYSNVAQGTYWHLMDFGSSAYQQYWLEGVQADIIDQPWVADGIFADNCLTRADAGGYSATPARYPSGTAWSAAMNNFVQGVTAGLAAHGQKLWCNRGETRLAEGSSAWLALDASANPPAIVMDEGAFAVEWGGVSTQFFPEAEWKRQLDTIGAIRNSKVSLMSHTKLMDGQSGTDNWGRPVSFGQVLWYALGSYLLAKNDQLDNTYFMFNGGSGYNRIWWFEEYERIDLGEAIGAYRVTNIGGVNVYWREFEKGYVYVNPTASNVASVTLPQASRLLTRATLASLLDTLPIVATIPLAGHHASIVLKTVATPAPDTQAPTVPTGLAASAVSGTQVNLSWNASTDNVGVTGYIVYLNDQQFASTASTSFSHTGLTAGTTYNYRVSAYDAVPNHSAWTAVVSATTAPTPPADTQAPSVPAGLTASAVSGTRVNLSWNASTDNVGVTGYIVYLNDQQLASTASTSFSHTGLTAGTTYNYRVSAYDAVPNHSAWTATVSATPRRRIRADFDGDGKTDILWRNADTGENYVYPMDGTTILPGEGYLRTVADANWGVAGIGDFDGDGKHDILWRDAASGENYLYLMNGTTIVSEGYLRTVADPNWRVAGVGDFDGDGKHDILWRNSASGENYLYLMNGTTIVNEGYLRTMADQNWRVAGVGDFDGDAKADVAWRHATTGENYLYPMDGTTIKPTEGYVRTVADAGWKIAAVGDYDGDGRSDLLWRNSATGENYLYPMDGTTIKGSEGYVRTVPIGSWAIAMP